MNLLFLSLLFAFLPMSASLENSVKPGSTTKAVLKTKGLISFWNFKDGSLQAQGPFPYRLRETQNSPEKNTDGPVSGYSLAFSEGDYLSIPRAECPALDLHGKEAQVTVLAWVKRAPKTIKPTECEAVAGMWLETDKKRQYCLFMNLRIYKSANQVCGHVSSVGGPTPGEKWCMDASIGQNPVPFGEWAAVAFTYDGRDVRSYLNGELDTREDRNPYHYPEGLFNAGPEGADFTVGAVHRSGEMGNFFAGQLGGLAVFNRALSAQEIKKLSQL